MEILKNKYLLVPLLIFTIVFAADKIFRLPVVLEYTVFWQKVEPDFYESRNWLFDQLRQEYPDRTASGQKLGVIFGTSRAGEFSTDYFARKIPGSYTYNFSAPLACPAFHYYFLSRMLDAGIRPDFVLIEADPVLFSSGAVDYSLSYSYDPVFVFRNTDYNRTAPANIWDAEGRGFSFDEAETYFLKQTFALYKFPLDINNVSENMRTITLPHPTEGLKTYQVSEFKKSVLNSIRSANKSNLGGIPNLIYFTVPPQMMEQDAENLANRHLAGFTPSQTQIQFFKKLIRALSYNNIRTIVYWPVVSEPLRRRMEKLRLMETFQKPLEQYLASEAKANPEFRAQFSDPYLDPALKCRQFQDATHLSGACFFELTDRILKDFKLQ